MLFYVNSGPYPPPNDVKLVSIDNKELLFSWTSVNNNCPYFLITFNGCGACPSSTNTTNITCSTTDTQLTSNVTVCTLRVQSVVCDHTSNLSDPISVNLKGTVMYNWKVFPFTVYFYIVPDAPEVQVIPRYFSDNQSLVSFRVFIQQMVCLLCEIYCVIKLSLYYRIPLILRIVSPAMYQITIYHFTTP